MVGQGVLLECLDDPRIEEVLLINRSPLGIQDNKVRELIHKSFEEFESVKEELKGYDACYCCMGVSSVGLSEQEYTKFTYDYTMSLINVLKDLNLDMTVCYVSGQGTDSSEQGRQMWARVKGRTENAIVKCGFTGSYMFRPGIIIPLRGIRSRTRLYQFFYDYFMWLIKLGKLLAPRSIVTTAEIGKAMINISGKGGAKILDPKDIQEEAKG